MTLGGPSSGSYESADFPGCSSPTSNGQLPTSGQGRQPSLGAKPGKLRLEHTRLCSGLPRLGRAGPRDRLSHSCQDSPSAPLIQAGPLDRSTPILARPECRHGQLGSAVQRCLLRPQSRPGAPGTGGLGHLPTLKCRPPPLPPPSPRPRESSSLGPYVNSACGSEPPKPSAGHPRGRTPAGFPHVG